MGLVSRASCVTSRHNMRSPGDMGLERMPHRTYGCSLPGSVQGQAGWGFEQPGLVEGVPAHGRVVGTR